MRLINVHTLEFEEFEGQKVPTYAILSHRWEDEEVLFRDMINATADRKKDMAKIKNCCRQAQRDEIDYVWIDTCCIDKSSSAELSEAINTMFRWYQKAEICYVYLSDVDTTPNDPQFSHAFKESAWFTRGWTLQELIAPEDMEFFNSDWEAIGSRTTLRSAIIDVTSIPLDILSKLYPLSGVPIAERMSWAAHRQTTRIEDRAYSLMGIFDINMPMLYGEGDNAFRRLQEEILRRSSDRSILLFQGPYLFASSPAQFYTLHQSTSDNVLKRVYERYEEEETCAMTNLGLSIALPLLPWYCDTFIALVAVEGLISGPDLLYFIYLRPSFPTSSRMFRTSWDHEFVRSLPVHRFDSFYTHCHGTAWIKGKTRRVIISSDSDPSPDIEGCGISKGTISLQIDESPVWGVEGFPEPLDVVSRSDWAKHDFKDGRLVPKMPQEILAIFRANKLAGGKGYLYMTFDENFELCVVYKERDLRLDSHYNDTAEAHLEILLHAESLWSWINNNDGSIKYQVIKTNRSVQTWIDACYAFIPDLGIRVKIALGILGDFNVKFTYDWEQ